MQFHGRQFGRTFGSISWPQTRYTWHGNVKESSAADMSNDKNLFETLAGIVSNGEDPRDHSDEIWDRYGREVAVLVLDSSGFSRISEQFGIIYFLSKLVVMRQLVVPVMAEHNRLTLHSEADNILATYSRPDDAVKAAMGAHEAIHRGGLMLTDDEPFTVCIGIGYGRLLYSETLEGYFGEEMNLASKLGEDTAEGREVLLTPAAYERTSPELVQGFESDELTISGIRTKYYRAAYRPEG